MKSANDQKKDYVLPGGKHSHDSRGQKLPEHRGHVSHMDQYTNVKEENHGHSSHSGKSC